MKKVVLLVLLLTSAFGSQLLAQKLYFPPVNQTATWETTSPEELGWCADKIDSLYSFLEKENSKALIVLKDGKIVLEKYFGTFGKDSVWYWASAGKTLTSFLIGKAQEEGLLSINDKSSKYLGKGWTSLTEEQEDKITIWNQLTMTSGLDDKVADNHCLLDTCLIYKADAGKRWAYHNAPYTLLEKVIETATAKKVNAYTQAKLSAKTGINGLWATLDYDNVFFSKARNFARFGLLYQNDCVWDKDTLLADKNYINASTNTSQNLNLSYGYLWWLNGKESFMVPTLQVVFKTKLVQNAPDDMYAGIGKNGQIVSVCKSKGLVVVRMGDAPNYAGDVSITLVDSIWKKLNLAMCSENSVESELAFNSINIYPNPSQDFIQIGNYSGLVSIYNILGSKVFEKTIQSNEMLDIKQLAKGQFYLVTEEGKVLSFTKD